MDEFSPGVARKINYYVYRLIDPRDNMTFYVGKGKGNRMFAHARAENGYDGEKFSKNEKLETIRAIKESKLKVKYKVHRHGMTDETAKEVEAALIDAYHDLTNQVSGHSTERGEQSPEQVEARYAVSESICPHPNHKLLLIKTKWETVDDHKHGSIEDAVRRSWLVSLERVRRVDYVLAVIDRKCVGVFAPGEKWDISPNQEGASPQKIRKQFPMGYKVHDSEVLQRYLHKKVPYSLWKRNAQGSLKYVD